MGLGGGQGVFSESPGAGQDLLSDGTGTTISQGQDDHRSELLGTDTYIRWIRSQVGTSKGLPIL